MDPPISKICKTTALGLITIPALLILLYAAEHCGVLIFLNRVGTQVQGFAGLLASIAGLIAALAAYKGVDTWRKQLAGTTLYEESRKFMRILIEYRDFIKSFRDLTATPEELEEINNLWIKRGGEYKYDISESLEERQSRWARDKRRQREELLSIRMPLLQDLLGRLYESGKELEVLGEKAHEKHLRNLEQITYDIHQRLNLDIQELLADEGPLDICRRVIDEGIRDFGERTGKNYDGWRSRGDKPDEADDDFDKEFNEIEQIVRQHLS